jgi:hypothetical protein
MAKRPSDEPGLPAAATAARSVKLAAALRANLKKRKAQVRARTAAARQQPKPASDA